MVTRDKKNKIEVGKDRPLLRPDKRYYLRIDLTVYARTRYNSEVGDLEEFINEFLEKYPIHLDNFDRTFIRDMAARCDRYGWR